MTWLIDTCDTTQKNYQVQPSNSSAAAAAAGFCVSIPIHSARKIHVYKICTHTHIDTQFAVPRMCSQALQNSAAAATEVANKIANTVTDAAAAGIVTHVHTH